jgi:hypothetical protein
MRSLIWKECHEHFKWVALPTLLIVGPNAFFGLHPPPLMDEGFLLYVGIVAALFGALLGFLQIFFEAGGDKRSLLLHRPLSGSQIFLGKAVVGVGLYVLAVGIPCAWDVALVATQGHIAEPFAWPMVLPLLADVLMGVVYYFAGMLLAQRDGRWYGSRGLGLAAALLGSFLVWVAPEFWQALLAIAVLGTLLALAAWGSFLTGGAYAPQPRLARAALAATFLAGLLLLGVLVKCTVGACIWGGKEEYYYTLARDGRVLVVGLKAGEIQGVTDLDGQDVEALKGKQLDASTLREIEAPLAGPVWHRFESYRTPSRFAVRCRNDTSSGDERWFYVPDQGCLLGYDGRSLRLIGRCGPDGFVPPDRQPRERFPGAPYCPTYLFEGVHAYYVNSPGGVYAIDFARRTVHLLFTPPAGETVQGARRWKDEKAKLSRALVLTDNAVHLVDEAGVRLFSAPRAYDRAEYGLVRVGRLENPERFAVWYEPSWYLRVDGGKALPGYVVEYDGAGRELSHRTVPPPPLTEPPAGQALLGVLTPPAEAALNAGATRDCIAAARRSEGRQMPPLLHYIAATVPLFVPGAGPDVASEGSAMIAYRFLILLSALAGGLGCYLLARRYSFRRAERIGWALCGLLFGPTGLLLMLALQEWPARIPCPSCRRARRVDRDRCEHCGGRHAVPPLDGTEIFEPSDGAPRASLVGHS